MLTTKFLHFVLILSVRCRAAPLLSTASSSRAAPTATSSSNTAAPLPAAVAALPPLLPAEAAGAPLLAPAPPPAPVLAPVPHHHFACCHPGCCHHHLHGSHGLNQAAKVRDEAGGEEEDKAGEPYSTLKTHLLIISIFKFFNLPPPSKIKMNL